MIAMLGPTPPPVLPSFRFDRTIKASSDGSSRPDEMKSGHCPPYGLLHKLREKGMRLDESMMPGEVDVYVGDLVADGSGELHLRRVDRA